MHVSSLDWMATLGSFSDGIGVFECDDTFDGRNLGDEPDGGAQPAGRGVASGVERRPKSTCQ
jgi:hypothetical protein